MARKIKKKAPKAAAKRKQPSKKSKVTIPFVKYDSTGNDFLVIDNRKKKYAMDDREFWARVCHRRFGVGADGVIFLCAHKQYDYEMVYLNADGAQVEMCGNGSRALAHFAESLKLNGKKNVMTFLASGVVYEVKLKQGPDKNWPAIHFPKAHSVDSINLNSFGHRGPHLFMNTGVPHCLFMLPNKQTLDQLDINQKALPVRHSKLFEKGTNVNFLALETLNEESVKIHIRTFERGVEAETFSCGTGAVAAATFYRMRFSKIDKVELATKGGPLLVEFIKETPWFSGPTRPVYKGDLFLS